MEVEKSYLEPTRGLENVGSFAYNRIPALKLPSLNPITPCIGFFCCGLMD